MHKAMFIQLFMGLLIGGSLGALLGHVGRCNTGTCPLTANPRRGAFLGALIGGLLALSAGPSATTVADGDRVSLRIGSAEEFERYVLKAEKPVLVDFYANWCGPCRRLAPTIESLAKEYEGRAVVSKVDVDKLGELAQRYGIRGIPAVLFFQDGREVQRLVGGRSKRAYEQVLDALTAPS